VRGIEGLPVPLPGVAGLPVAPAVPGGLRH